MEIAACRRMEMAPVVLAATAWTGQQREEAALAEDQEYQAECSAVENHEACNTQTPTNKLTNITQTKNQTLVNCDTRDLNHILLSFFLDQNYEFFKSKHSV